MQIVQVDPRDALHEADSPVYWVVFWEQQIADDCPPGAVAAYESDEWRVIGATDVFEVITWANSDSAGRSYTMYCEFTTRSGGIAIARLAGIDPTKHGAGDSTFVVGSPLERQSDPDLIRRVASS